MALVPIERQVNVATVAARLRQQMGLKDAATKEASEFATAAEGILATTALQPEDIAAVATSGSYNDLSDKPGLGSAAAADVEAFATAAQGALADSAVQPDDLGDTAFLDIGTTAGTVAAGDDERILEVAYKGPSYYSRTVAAARDLSAYQEVGIRRWSSSSRLAEAIYANKGTVEPSHDLKFQDSAGNWFEIAEKRINVDMAGALPDNASDNTPAFLRTAAACLALGATAVCEWRGDAALYRLITDTPINLRTIPVDFTNCRIRLHHSGIGFLVGNRSDRGEGPIQRFGKVFALVPRTSADAPTIRVLGTKNVSISVDSTDFFQVYANTNSADQVPFPSGSIGYCTFNLNYPRIIEITTNPSSDGGAEQWVNQNKWNLVRCDEFLINGTYPHNCNLVEWGTFENGAKRIRIETGNSNQFRNLRLEGNGTEIYLGPNTFNNLIERWWRGSPQENPEEPAPEIGVSITDLGINNHVTTLFQNTRHYETVAYTDISETVLNSEVGDVTARTAELQKVYAAGGQQILAISEFLPAKRNDFYFWGLDGDPADTILYRPSIFLYDAQLNPVTAVVGMVSSPTFQSVSDNQLRPSTGQRSAMVYIDNSLLDAGVKFVRVAWLSSSGQQQYHLARALWVRKATSQRSSLTTGETFASRRKTHSIVNAAPSVGFAPFGYEARRWTGSAWTIYRCVFSLSTSLSAAAASGAASITVSTGTGIAIGDIIGINMDNRRTHWTTVSSVSGTTLGLTAALPSAAANGMRVVFNRWASS